MSQTAPRPTALPSHPHIRPSSGLATSNSTSTSTNPNTSTNSRQSQQANILTARIAEKKIELGNLQQLRDLSAGLAGQMQQLEQKLATLNDGTQAVAEVLSNWSSVLRAVYMASTKVPKPPKEEGEAEVGEGVGVELPQTLVRIPIQQAEAAQKEIAEAAAVEGAAE